MPQTEYEKYLVRKPLYEWDCGAKRNRQCPSMTLMSRAQVPEDIHYIQLGWISGIPAPNPHTFEHRHKYEEILLFLGGNSKAPRKLGADITYCIDGQPIEFNTTSAIFIPKGVPHGTLTWKDYRKPHILLGIMIGAGNQDSGWAMNGNNGTKNELPRTTTDVDYEELIVRSPIREVGRSVINRQMPTMTYMSRHQVLGANYYIEYGWIYGMPEPNPHIFEHLHNYDEIVLHIGGDPENPEDLGGEIEYCIERQPLIFNTSSALFIPKGLKHGPLTWKKYFRPHIEMTIIFGAGTFREVWAANAFRETKG
jgi:hypothetical protein